MERPWDCKWIGLVTFAGVVVASLAWATPVEIAAPVKVGSVPGSVFDLTGVEVGQHGTMAFRFDTDDLLFDVASSPNIGQSCTDIYCTGTFDFLLELPTFTQTSVNIGCTPADICDDLFLSLLDDVDLGGSSVDVVALRFFTPNGESSSLRLYR